MEQKNASERRALVVEDESVIARVVAKILAAEGFSVAVAADGSAARDIMTQETFDLYILNIHLPGISGMGLYEYLQREWPELGGRTLFITGDILGRDTEEFLKKAERPFLLKPFTPEELKATVRDVANAGKF